jgi:predicted dienelactone hydrolase
VRPLEWVLAIGAGLLLLGWAAGGRVRRWWPLGLAAVGVLHVLLEGQRLVMWPVYLIVAVAALVVLRRRGGKAPPRGRWRAIGRWAVAGLILIVAVPLPWLWPVMKLPAPSGPYRVGTRWMVVEDLARPERFAVGRHREFPVKAWYPIDPATRGPMAPYATVAELTMGGPIPPILFQQGRYIKTHSVLDAEPARGERFPVLIFSHGYGGYAAQNTPQMEELASLGYAVFSIAHPGEATAAPFPDGRVILVDSSVTRRTRALATDTAGMARSFALMARFDSVATREARQALFRELVAATPEPIKTESVKEWSLDTKVLVDLLERMNAGAVPSPFTGRLDLDRLGVFGMSYGGATAGEFCRLDRRCKAGLNIDGGQFGGFMDDSLTTPFLILASSQAYGVHKPALDVLRGPGYLVKIPETTHMGLTDLTLQGPTLFRWTGLTGRLDPDRRMRLMSEYIVAFFDTYLRGKPAPLLDGPSARDPDVAFVRSNP